jgi:hypothetical protein
VGGALFYCPLLVQASILPLSHGPTTVANSACCCRVAEQKLHAKFHTTNALSVVQTVSL